MRRILACLALCLALSSAWAQASGPSQPGQPAAQPRRLIKAGEQLPALSLPMPQAAADTAYLGLPAGAKAFGPADIQARFVLLEVFNAFCPHCQHDAPAVSRVHGLIKEQGLDGRIKLLGIGANNTPYEVGLFRDRFEPSFPLVPDKDMDAARALGVASTPTYILASLPVDGKPATVLLVQEGRLPGTPEEFLAAIRAASGL